MEISAGGIVFFNNSILMLKKYSGDWVLPKGRIEKGESLEETALREVFEETGARAEIIRYLGKISYSYRQLSKNQRQKKTVHWYLMVSQNMNCQPLRKEGFIEASYVHVDKAIELIAFDSEREMVKKAIDIQRG